MEEDKHTETACEERNVNPPEVKITDGTTTVIAEDDGLKEIRNDVPEKSQDTQQPDLNTHIEVFNELLKKVANSPHELSLLKILRHLVDIDPNTAGSDLVWNTMTEVILRTIYPETQPQTNLNSAPSLPPPPPPPLSSPRPQHHRNGSFQNTGTTNPSAVDVDWLPQQIPPIPKVKLKSLCWDAIPRHEIVGGTNLWTILGISHNIHFGECIDWNEAELLFCQQSCTNTVESTMKRKQKLKLLNSQRTFSVDIFLEQFKGLRLKSDSDIIELVYEGEHKVMGSEKINRLLKLLPEKEEIDLLKNYAGNRDNLARAELFLIHLIEVNNYKLRIECMSLKEDFTESVQYLKSSIKLVIQAGNELISNKRLHEVLYIIVLVGNFLNSGKYSGNAIGITVSSLLKLAQTRANANNMHFMHFIVIQIKESLPDLLNFPKDLKSVDKVNRINIEQIFTDAKILKTRVREVRTQIELPHTEEDVKEQMMAFLKKAENQIENLKKDLKDIESMRLNLSRFFCENPSKFRLKECFKIFQSFSANFKQAEFEAKTLQRQKHVDEEGTLRALLTSKSSYGLTPNSPLSVRRFGKTTPEATSDFIGKELNREMKKMAEGKNRSRPTKAEYTGKAGITHIPNTKEVSAITSEEYILRPEHSHAIKATDGNRKSWSEPSNMSVADKIKKFCTNIDTTEEPRFRNTQKAETTLTTKVRETPPIPKYQRIGVRVLSINEDDLQEIIPKLRTTPSGNRKFLWDIPREQLLRNSNLKNVSLDNKFSNLNTNIEEMDETGNSSIELKNKSSDNNISNLNANVEEMNETGTTSIESPTRCVSVGNGAISNPSEESHAPPTDNPQNVTVKSRSTTSSPLPTVSLSSATMIPKDVSKNTVNRSNPEKKSISFAKRIFNKFRFNKK